MTTLHVAITQADRVANSDYAMTLEEIGARMGLTRERVRQIQNTALSKLRENCMPQLERMREMAIELRRNGASSCHGVIQ